MKKIILTLSATLFFAACAAPPTNREATSTTNANAPMETKTAAPLTEADAVAKEKAIWEALQKKDYTTFGGMLTEDSILVATDGVHDKAGIIKSVTGWVPSDVTFSDWKFIPIDKDAGIIMYTLKYKGMMNGQEIKPQNQYCSSIWVNRNGKWLAIFHQETDVMTAPPTPTAAPKPEKAAPSPAAASSPAVTTSDAVANEKAVWAALKARDYVTFASFLPAEFMEIEASGVTDKEASVKAAQGFDLSKSELSDWKTVKIDDDASVVTYKVKMPGAKPETEFHSTVWVNRNGKWTGLFHQGTPMVVPPAQPSPSKPAVK